MNSNISVDILITFYNQKDCVERAVTSVLSQKCDFPINIIIGDDGSTDGTIEIIKSLAHKYECISYIVMDRNINKKYEPIERVSNLRKKLLSLSNSKYVCFLDGDDYYTNPNKISYQVEQLENNSNLIACAHNYTYYWENDNIEKIGVTNLEKGIISSDVYWKKYYIHNMSFIFRNVTNGKIVPEIDSLYFDDNTITLYYLQFGDFYYLPESYCRYVQQSVSSWNGRSNFEQHVINALDYYDEIAFAKEKSNNAIVRHYQNFKYLFLNKKRNSIKMTEFFEKRINQTGNKSLLFRLCNYKDISFQNKMHVYIDMLILTVKYLYYR